MVLCTRCGVSEGQLDEEFTAAFCDQATRCDPNTECAPDVSFAEAFVDCDYHRRAAKECLSGAWSCEGPIVAMPAACEAVWTKSGGLFVDSCLEGTFSE